jgi:hypothetical protein
VFREHVVLLATGAMSDARRAFAEAVGDALTTVDTRKAMRNTVGARTAVLAVDITAVDLADWKWLRRMAKQGRMVVGVGIDRRGLLAKLFGGLREPEPVITASAAANGLCYTHTVIPLDEGAEPIREMLLQQLRCVRLRFRSE